MAAISSSIVQGSALGPASYTVTAADLRTVTPGNFLAKFADDTYLIVPANFSHTVSAELDNIEVWSANNNLKLNKSKSHEIIFQQHNSRKAPIALPPPINGIQRVDEIKCLGVTLSFKLSFSQHINETLTTCSQSLYALRNLKAHGLCNDLPNVIFKATTLSKLLYASPVWWGFVTAAEKQRLEAFLKKARRCHFYSENEPSFSTLCEQADEKLFAAIINNPHHVLYPLLPPKQAHSYNLRPRPHPIDRDPAKINRPRSENFSIPNALSWVILVGK